MSHGDVPRRRASDASFYERHRGSMRLLLGGGVLSMVLAYTALIREYTISNQTLANVVLLAQEHSRILKERETDVRAAAILRSEFDSHVSSSTRADEAIEKRIEIHDAQLRDLEQRMYERVRGGT